MLSGEIASVTRRLFPFMLSHHPICSYYHDDMIRINNNLICMGCSVAYPTALLTIIFLHITKLYRPIPDPLFNESILLAGSMIIGSLQGIKYLTEIEHIQIRFMVKVALGLSLGGMIIWTLVLPLPWPVRIFLLMVILTAVLFSGSLRLFYFRRKCSRCIYHGDWDICFGFRGINRYHHFRKIGTKRGIYRLIFDVSKKKGAPEGGPVAKCDDPEPELIDDNVWLYHDKKTDVPWLPKTGMEVDRYLDIPKR